jgi:hypothetical protein
VVFLLICESWDIAVLSAILYASLFLADFISLIIPDLPFFSWSIAAFIWSSFESGADGAFGAAAGAGAVAAGFGAAVATGFVCFVAALSSLSKSPSLIKLGYKHQVICP